MDASTTVQRSSKQLSTSLGEEAVVLQLDRGIYYGLDPVGARVWDLLAEPRSVSQLRDTICAEYEVDQETCERDVTALLRRLIAEGLAETPE